MPTPEALRHRVDVDPADVDDIIGIAAELAEAQREAAGRASVADVEAVARELDLSPAHVEAAITELARRREEARRADAQAAAATAARRAGVRQVLLGVAVLAVVALGIFAARVGTTAVTLAQQEHEVALAEANLRVVLDRRASLMPQLLGLAGGDPGALSERVEAYRGAPDLDAAIAAADRLGEEMGRALGALPATDDSNAARQRAELGYELTGIANRISTEQRRYREAIVTWQAAARGPTASVALSLGLASAPPR